MMRTAVVALVISASKGSAAHKVVDLLAGLLVREAHAVVGLHNAVASPLAHGPTQVGLVALAHGALGAEGLHTCR